MNKFQKAALQIAKDDSKKKEFEDISIRNIIRNSRGWYSYIKAGRWSYGKVLDFKTWNKSNKF